MAKATFDAKIEGGKLVYPDPDWFIQTVADSFKRDQPVRVTVAGARESKTDRQNRFFHGVVVKMFLDALLNAGVNTITKKFGNVERVYPMNFDRAKELLKLEVNVQRIEGGGWSSVHVGNASKTEMSALIECCKVYLDENFGIEIPDPKNFEQ